MQIGYINKYFTTRLNPSTFKVVVHNYKTFLIKASPDLGPRAKDFYKDHQFRNLQDMPKPANGTQIPQWSYFQIRHFLSCKNHKEDYMCPLTLLETLLDLTSAHRHLVSAIYRTFFQDHMADVDVAARQ